MRMSHLEVQATEPRAGRFPGALIHASSLPLPLYPYRVHKRSCFRLSVIEQ